MNKYDPGQTSIQLRFTKLLDGNVPDDSNKFSFQLLDNNVQVLQTVTNAGASVQFDPLTFNKTGEYTYYVRETPTDKTVNNDATIDYDAHVIQVNVSITEDDNGNLESTAQIIGDTTFRNECKPAELGIAKKVYSDIYIEDNTKEFSFNVRLLDSTAQPLSGSYGATLTDAYDTNPTYTSVTFDKTGSALVKIKNRQKIIIHGIPAHSKYTIEEVDMPSGYALDWLENANGLLSPTGKTIAAAWNRYESSPTNASIQVFKRLTGPNGNVQDQKPGEFGFALCEVNLIEPNSALDDELGEHYPSDTCTGLSQSTNQPVMDSNIASDPNTQGLYSVTFPNLKYTEPGVYLYQIREIGGDSSNIDYDGTVFNVIVNVSDDGEGHLVAEIKYFDEDGNPLEPSSDLTGTGSGVEVSNGNTDGDATTMVVPVFVNQRHEMNRMPVTGGREIIYAAVIIALAAGALFITSLERRKQQ